MPHGRNTSHLLCGYKLWVGGVPLGMPAARDGLLNIPMHVSVQDRGNSDVRVSSTAEDGTPFKVSIAAKVDGYVTCRLRRASL